MGESSSFHDYATAIKLLLIDQPPGRVWIPSTLFRHGRHVGAPFGTSTMGVRRLILDLRVSIEGCRYLCCIAVG